MKTGITIWRSTGKTHQPPRPGNELCKHQIIKHPGHPSLKRRACPASAGGNFFYTDTATIRIILLKFVPDFDPEINSSW